MGIQLSGMERLIRLPKYRRLLPVTERLAPLTSGGRELRLLDLQGRSPAEIERLKEMVDRVRLTTELGAFAPLEVIGSTLAIAKDNPFLKKPGAPLPFQAVMVSIPGLNELIIDRDLRKLVGLPADLSQIVKDGLYVETYGHNSSLSERTASMLAYLQTLFPGLKLPCFIEAQTIAAFTEHLDYLLGRKDQIVLGP